jgi:hypothetical protein
VLGYWRVRGLLNTPASSKGGAWELSNDEFGTWDGFLKHAMNKANDSGVDEISVLDHVAEQVARSPCPAFASSTRVADLILSHCEMDDARQFPCNVFDFVNDTLLSTYPPEPRNLKPCMWLIASLTRVVDACPVDFRLNLLEMIQDGVSTWLSDEYRVFTQEEYALDVLPLYQTALLGVQELPRNLTVLEVLSPLLQCVFIGRDDKPSNTKEAFVDFWTATFADYDDPEGGWPEDLQVCLRCCIAPTEEVPGVKPDIELSWNVREGEDSTVYASSSDDTATEVLCSSPTPSLLGSESGSLCSERTVRTYHHRRATSPFVGKLAPALFPPLADLQQSVGDRSRSSSPQPTNRTSTEPSTPIKRALRAVTPPRPQKPVTTPQSFQSLLLKPPAGDASNSPDDSDNTTAVTSQGWLERITQQKTQVGGQGECFAPFSYVRHGTDMLQVTKRQQVTLCPWKATDARRITSRGWTQERAHVIDVIHPFFCCVPVLR